MTNFRNIVFYIILATVTVLPLAVWKIFFFPAVFTKTLFFLTIIDVALFFWVPYAWRSIFVHIRKPIPLTILLFFFTVVITSITGVNVRESMWSNYERMLGVWTLGHLMLFFLMLITTYTCEKEWGVLFFALTLGSLPVSIAAIVEMIQGGGAVRVESTFYNAAFLAQYLLLAGMVIVGFLLQHRHVTKTALLSVASLLFLLLALFFTGTRGVVFASGIFFMFLLVAFLALGSGTGYVLSIPERRLRKYAFSLIITLSAVVVAGILFREDLKLIPFDPIQRLGSISLGDRTVTGRLLGWRVAWEGWERRPVLGWGPENFDLAFNAYYNAALFEQEPWFDRAHNFIFDVGVTVGMAGLLSYLCLFGVAGWVIGKAWWGGRISFWVWAVFSLFLLVYLVSNFFLFDTLMSLLFLMIVLAYIHVLTRREAPVSYLGSLRWLLVPTAIFSSAVFYLGVWKPAFENYYGKRGYDAFAGGRPSEGVAFVEKALSYDTYGNIDVRRSVAEYVFEFLKQGGTADQATLRTLLDYAITKMEQNIEERPDDVKWYMYQGQLYNLGAVIFGELNKQYAAKAEKRYLEAATLSPGRPQIYLEIAQARKVQENYRGMWEALDRAVSIAPTYPAVYMNIAVHAIEVGDTARERRSLDWLEKNNAIDIITLRDTYYKAHRFTEAIAMQRKYIESKEKDSGFSSKNLAVEYKNLAIYYKENKEFSNARLAAQHVVTLDPSQAVAAKMFLQALEE